MKNNLIISSIEGERRPGIYRYSFSGYVLVLDSNNKYKSCSATLSILSYKHFANYPKLRKDGTIDLKINDFNLKEANVHVCYRDMMNIEYDNNSNGFIRRVKVPLEGKTEVLVKGLDFFSCDYTINPLGPNFIPISPKHKIKDYKLICEIEVGLDKEGPLFYDIRY